MEGTGKALLSWGQTLILFSFKILLLALCHMLRPFLNIGQIPPSSCVSVSLFFCPSYSPCS